jgi:outer membrane protein assembly factor BamA
MRCRLAQIAIFTTACLLAGKLCVRAQSTNLEIHTELSCPPPPIFDDERPSGPEISIAELVFTGSPKMSISDQNQIAASIKQRTHGDVLDGVINEALERVRAGWEDHGYFKVQANGYATTLTSSAVGQQVALSVYVDEGTQYSFGEITFRNNKAISNVEALRGLFPVKDGDIFSRERVATGLENLRKAYGQLGYINFTSVPDTQFDDENKLIHLDVDLGEGKQFYVSSVNILGLDEPSTGNIEGLSDRSSLQRETLCSVLGKARLSIQILARRPLAH